MYTVLTISLSIYINRVNLLENKNNLNEFLKIFCRNILNFIKYV